MTHGGSPTMATEPPAKRARLSMACNECRRRKVKCDAIYPKCQNCARRNHECFTSDSRRPNVPVLREWIEDRSSAVQSSPAPTARIQDVLNHSPAAAIHHVIHTPAVPTSTVEEVSPLQLPYEMSFNADRHSNRMKMMGSSSAQCLIKSLDLYLEKAALKPILPHFQYGLRHTEELDIPLMVSLPPFPAEPERILYLRHFFSTIHMLWPICTVDETKAAIHALASIQDFSTFTRDHIPMLTLSYLIMSLGADEAAQGLSVDGNKYLVAATTLLGHVLMVPYLDTVQALLAYTIAYRGRSKDGLAWQMVGMATRIAQTLGLHKFSLRNPSLEHGVTDKSQQQFHARIWAICCCLEKLLQLEGGRPSSISTVSDDQLLGDQRPLGRPNFLLWSMKLAEHQHGICRHIYGHRPGERCADDILQITAHLDDALLSWSAILPLEYQPENIMFCTDEHFPIAAFLCIQFHQAVITLHRAALIAPRGLFDTEVDKYCPNSLSKFRIKGGETISMDSARAIVRITLEIAERGVHSRIHSLSPVILSCIAIAIYLMKHPQGKTQGADLELLKSGLEFTSEQYTAAGQDHRVVKGLASIYDKVRSHLHKQSSKESRGQIQAGYAQTARNKTSFYNKNIGNNETDSSISQKISQSTSEMQFNQARDSVEPDLRGPRLSNTAGGQSPSDQTNSSYPAMASSNNMPPNWGGAVLASLPQSFPSQSTNNAIDGSISNSELGNGDLPFDQYSIMSMWDWMV
ncbi:uncharacterized protein PV09_08629 [Verruconis gallopava]|uniref:Zn(2)-C6 fungal-type domain-containing protein n=1 Tax=Verruconis gallopava TaxID=253628 RepID=A0A0D1YG10_9PEZI|nr:uncharacterized protein PV09_08629 [Verruconis gallopava]KIV99696.1 hypothetical protein PV09_08629 [Verruconis gallopava]